MRSISRDDSILPERFIARSCRSIPITRARCICSVVIEAQQEHYDVAADLIARAAAAAPGNPFIHYNLGNVLRSLGRFEDALASYDRALAIDPTIRLR
jgi:tetratricopeptide (TPR) repeat protein